MAKVKYDVSDVDDITDAQHAPVGIYTAKVEACEPKQSKNNNAMLETRFKLTRDAKGAKVKDDFAPIFYYPILDHDNTFVQGRLKEFLLAFGLKVKGTLDTDKIVGKSVQLKLKSDTDQDGEYRPSVSKVMGSASEAAGEDEPEPEEATDEPDEATDEDGEVDLDDLDRKGLKALIKEEELEIPVKKGMSDEEIREAINEALGSEEEEEEEDEDEEEEEDEDEGQDYSSMSVADLKAELAERELANNGAKKVLVKRLEQDDSVEPF